MNGPQNGTGCLLSDHQSANHPFVNGMGYADASITALVQFLGTGEDNHAAFTLKELCDLIPGEAGQLRYFSHGVCRFQSDGEIILARTGDGPAAYSLVFRSLLARIVSIGLSYRVSSVLSNPIFSKVC